MSIDRQDLERVLRSLLGFELRKHLICSDKFTQLTRGCGGGLPERFYMNPACQKYS